jgi:hypothetical protein
MVDLFNRIDDAAWSDLRLLNEQNALRVEARIDLRAGDLRAETERLGARMDTRLAEQHAMLERALHGHTRWMIGMWAAVIASQIGLWLRN